MFRLGRKKRKSILDDHIQNGEFIPLSTNEALSLLPIESRMEILSDGCVALTRMLREGYEPEGLAEAREKGPTALADWLYEWSAKPWTESINATTAKYVKRQ